MDSNSRTGYKRETSWLANNFQKRDVKWVRHTDKTDGMSLQLSFQNSFLVRSTIHYRPLWRRWKAMEENSVENGTQFQARYISGSNTAMKWVLMRFPLQSVDPWNLSPVPTCEWKKERLHHSCPIDRGSKDELCKTEVSAKTRCVDDVWLTWQWGLRLQSRHVSSSLQRSGWYATRRIKSTDSTTVSDLSAANALA